MTKNTLVKVIFQGLCQNIFSWFLFSFGKLETAIFKDHLSVLASESNYVNNCFKPLSKKISDRKKERNNLFLGWKICLLYAYFFHWFQAEYTNKRFAYKTKHETIVQFLSYMIIKKEELEVTFFDVPEIFKILCRSWDNLKNKNLVSARVLILSSRFPKNFKELLKSRALF